MEKIKSYHQLERIMRGISNHRRIQVLELLKNKPELSILDISNQLDVNFKTISEHVKRLAATGLVLKRSDGNSVRHKVTNRGLAILKFLRTLE